MNPDDRPWWLRLFADAASTLVAAAYALLAWLKVIDFDRDEPGGQR